MDDTTKRLLSTTDAQVWAEEFHSRFVVVSRGSECDPDDDEGLMIGWFANAIETAKSAERRRIAEQIVGFPITIDADRLGRDSQ